MNVHDEIEGLRRELDAEARKADRRLGSRYALWHPPGGRRSAYLRLRKALGRLLRRLGLRPARAAEPWRPALRHAEYGDDARPLVIWALGANRERLREACRGFEQLLHALPGYAPVLVTDVADFAFFSRLGWLVEYVPALSAPAGGYAERKRRYLAWRYRDAPALPLSAGLDRGLRPEQLGLD